MSPESAGARQPFARTRRREVARACAFGPRTAAEVARVLATETGSVTTVIEKLVDEGILLRASARHTTARAYELAAAWRPELLAAIASEAPRGQLEPERRILLIGARDAGAFARVVTFVAAAPVVLWAARVDGAARLLVIARGDTTEQRDQIDQLEVALAGEGAECVQLRVDRVLELNELARYARTLIRPPLQVPGELQAPGEA